MPVFDSNKLLDTLEKDVLQTIQVAQHLQTLTPAQLSTPPQPGKWNIVQVIYHLNSYNKYYLAHIENAIKNGSHLKSNGAFKAGVIGNYFAKTMLPGENGTIKNEMKAPADHTPAPNYNNVQALTDFINGQNKLISLLKTARTVNLTRITVPISISRFIKIRLGDTFRFLIAHQQRHFVQIDNIKKVVG